MARFDVAVVGGGLVGTATAYELGARGVRTLLVDRADTGRATDAGAGILSPGTTERDEPGWVDLVRLAGRHYDDLIPKLGSAAGWARCGILQLATRASDIPSWEWVAEHATGAREVSADDARSMVPVLGEVVRALHHPAAARVDGRMLCAALRAAAVSDYGVEVHEESVEDVRKLPADVVVIAGGAWSPQTADALGVTLPVGPQRGQIIHLGVDGHDTGAWPIVQPVFGYYMVPWADARVAVGATVEDVGFATDVTAGGVHEVLRETLRVMPGLAAARLREVRVGLRPASADDLPLLGALPGVVGVFVATGHGANGLLLGPVSGALVADVLCGREPAIDLAPFDPARFSARA